MNLLRLQQISVFRTHNIFLFCQLKKLFCLQPRPRHHQSSFHGGDPVTHVNHMSATLLELVSKSCDLTWRSITSVVVNGHANKKIWVPLSISTSKLLQGPAPPLTSMPRPTLGTHPKSQSLPTTLTLTNPQEAPMPAILHPPQCPTCMGTADRMHYGKKEEGVGRGDCIYRKVGEAGTIWQHENKKETHRQGTQKTLPCLQIITTNILNINFEIKEGVWRRTREALIVEGRVVRRRDIAKIIILAWASFNLNNPQITNHFLCVLRHFVPIYNWNLQFIVIYNKLQLS